MDSTNNYMNQTDFYRVLDAIPPLKIRKWLDEDIQMLFKILYWSALRPSEGIGLSKSDINCQDRRIFLGQTKTNKNDTALIPTRFTDELENWLVEKEPGELFRGLTYDTFYRWLKRLGKELNIEAWTVHQSITGEKTVGHIFRKSIGKAMIYGEVKNKQGQPFEIPIVSKLMRHGSIEITQTHYLKANIETVAQQY